MDAQTRADVGKDDPGRDWRLARIGASHIHQQSNIDSDLLTAAGSSQTLGLTRPVQGHGIPSCMSKALMPYSQVRSHGQAHTNGDRIAKADAIILARCERLEMRISRTGHPHLQAHCANRSLRRYRQSVRCELLSNGLTCTDVTENSLYETQKSHRCSHACTGAILLVEEGWTSDPRSKPTRIADQTLTTDSPWLSPIQCMSSLLEWRGTCNDVEQEGEMKVR